MNFILESKNKKVKKLEEYMGVIGSDFMQLSLEVIMKLKEEIRMEENRVKKVEKIMRYPDTEDLEPLNGHKFSKALTKRASFDTPKFVSPKSLSINSPQVLPSFEVYTPPVTYPEEVEEIIGISMEVEALDHTKLEDLGLNTCSHDIFLSSREIPSVDESEPQLRPNLMLYLMRRRLEVLRKFLDDDS
ncbi:hypothetical protein Tco_0839469 [Tanacetum coccineum]|uniref:Uncharacterized protein n=1 Tax=Tanacetum coccineum TaxID=301880 RepID=A0ABQ5ATV7_9ASTR